MKSLKHIGYYISKGKCLKAYVKLNKKTNKYSKKRVNYKGKSLKKGCKLYKTKSKCMKKLKSMKKTKKQNKKTKKKVNKKKNKFGECTYSVPFFGQFVPTVAKNVHGTNNTGYSTSKWMWPCPPGALVLDNQHGSYKKM